MTPLPEEERRLLDWIGRATRELSHESRVRVQQEIRDHYESARDNELASGTDPDVAGLFALNALGDPKAANRAYRKVHLTTADERELRELEDRRTQAIFAVAFFLGLLLCLATGVRESFYDHGQRNLLGIACLMIVFLPWIATKRSLIWSRFFLGALGILASPLFYFSDDPYLLVVLCTVIFVRSWPVIKRRRQLRRKLPIEKWPDGLFF